MFQDMLAAGSGGGTKTLLWTNDSPMNSFNAQTLTINALSSYSAILIKTKFYSQRSDASEVGWSRIELRNDWQIGCTCQSSGEWIGFRSVLAYGTSIEFLLGKIMKYNYNSASETPNAVYAIPLEIYGCNEI